MLKKQIFVYTSNDYYDNSLIKTGYQQAFSFLIYIIMITQFDIAYAVSTIS